jgi:imidazoleglycerol-phosphate dehydratase
MLNDMRTAKVNRETKETKIFVKMNLDGSGKAEVETPVSFLNHMLRSLATHGMFDLTVKADGDLTHHIVEDVALGLGQALREAIGDAEGITRFGAAAVPMDESLAEAAVDVSGRPYCVVDLKTVGCSIEDMASEDATHFIESLTSTLRATVHVAVQYGANDHHKVEAAFKSLALALRQAVSSDRRRIGIPSSKGVL